jgi:AraC-like DNA-binding protein
MQFANRLSANSFAPRQPISHEMVDVATLRCFPELVSQLGGNPGKLLHQVRIEPSLLRKTGSVIEYRSLLEVLECAADELSCPDFGIRMAAMQGGNPTIGPVAVVMKNSQTLGHAIDYSAKYAQAHSLPKRVHFERDGANGLFIVWVEILLDDLPDKRQAVEHVLMLANLNVLELSGGAVRARKVLFSHAPQLSPRSYRTYFGCEVLFCQKADGLVLSEGDLEQPVVSPDPRIYEMATSFIEDRYPKMGTSLAERIRSLVRIHLGSSACNSDRVAAELCMHRRTLHRRLRAERTSFETIKDEIRRDVAMRYIREGGRSLKRLADMLGYAETSVVSRSFCRWFSATPSQLRLKFGLKAEGPPRRDPSEKRVRRFQSDLRATRS